MPNPIFTYCYFSISIPLKSTESFKQILGNVKLKFYPPMQRNIINYQLFGHGSLSQNMKLEFNLDQTHVIAANSISTSTTTIGFYTSNQNFY